MDVSKEIEKQLKALPKQAGVYQFYDENNTILYVGKAKSLSKRVRSYFQKEHLDGKTRVLVKKIRTIKYIVVDTEYDALLLENSLIKENQPRYNIQLKDDKTYPWICIKKERFPRIFSTRNPIKDGSQYFGPYASVKVMNNLLDLVQKLYPLRTCSYHLSEENIKNNKFRACLEYQIGNCLAPCIDKQTEDNYNENIKQIRKIIRGNLNQVISFFKQKMKEHADNFEFEQAQSIKEKLSLLEKYQAKSTIVNRNIHDVDVFNISEDKETGNMALNYLKIWYGAITQSHTVEIKRKIEENNEELLASLVLEMRNRFESTSKEIYLPFKISFPVQTVKVHVPQKGDKKKLLELSERNAHFYLLDKKKQASTKSTPAHQRILQTLQEDLKLSELPTHIECFDNSNLQGHQPVAACVVFKNAKPSKKDYRHFNIKTVEGPDDFASMQEVVFRRYKRLKEEDSPLPQLIIIDGGKGQLSSAVKSLKELDLYGQIAIIGIAKRLEEIYFPNDSVPIYLDKRSESLKLIQQLRNEAHRFGITHHRKKRNKSTLHSELEDIQGIGKKTVEKLLKHFKSIQRLKNADAEEVKKLVGKKVQERLANHFKS